MYLATSHSLDNPAAPSAILYGTLANSLLTAFRHTRADVTEDMRMQALCKAFALEFNGLLQIEPPLDFIVTSCLQKKGVSGGSLSLEPFIDGKYVKYNNNAGWITDEDLADHAFNQIAQAFSHFTFERSWGRFLVNDLQGVGRILTDPSIQTQDPERFKLNDTNLGEVSAHGSNTFRQRKLAAVRAIWNMG